MSAFSTHKTINFNGGQVLAAYEKYFITDTDGGADNFSINSTHHLYLMHSSSTTNCYIGFIIERFESGVWVQRDDVVVGGTPSLGGDESKPRILGGAFKGMNRIKPFIMFSESQDGTTYSVSAGGEFSLLIVEAISNDFSL